MLGGRDTETVPDGKKIWNFMHLQAVGDAKTIRFLHTSEPSAISSETFTT